MKNLYITFISTFTLFTSYYSNAQEIIVPLEPAQSPGQGILNNPSEAILYFKDTNNNLDKFVGNWLYDDGTDYLAIEVVKYEHSPIGIDGFYNDNDFQDVLHINMEYHLNGVVKYNSDNAVSISGNILDAFNIIELLYNEPSLISCERRNNARLILEYRSNFPNGQPQLIWTRENGVRPGFSVIKCPDGSEPDASEFLIPENLVLTKQ